MARMRQHGIVYARDHFAETVCFDVALSLESDCTCINSVHLFRARLGGKHGQNACNHQRSQLEMCAI